MTGKMSTNEKASTKIDYTNKTGNLDPARGEITQPHTT